MKIGKYSMGCGDRFACSARAQLAAYEKIAEDGIDVVPVWNKSNREHVIIGTEPVSVRNAAEAAVEEADWKGEWHVDADHINLNTVDAYLESADFFTMDVADSIGGKADESEVREFLKSHTELVGKPIAIDGLEEPLFIDEELGLAAIRTYLPAVKEAGAIYRHILSAKGQGNFISEVSIDETDVPQGPAELLLIMAALSDEQIPVQTLAPRFSGRFNKGVEYVGNPSVFAAEFEADILAVRYAVRTFNLPGNLKLSVHSGSDKFAIYSEINRITKKLDAGVHVKTAGTTWLEEIIGLAESGGDGLEIAKTVYAEAFEQRDALCAPYASIIDIDDSRLPSVEEVPSWSAEEFVRALRHNSSDELYNADFRQLIHIGYKVAAKMGDTYYAALAEHAECVARNVTYNLYERHLKPLFG